MSSIACVNCRTCLVKVDFVNYVQMFGEHAENSCDRETVSCHILNLSEIAALSANAEAWQVIFMLIASQASICLKDFKVSPFVTDACSDNADWAVKKGCFSNPRNGVVGYTTWNHFWSLVSPGISATLHP